MVDQESSLAEPPEMPEDDMLDEQQRRSLRAQESKNMFDNIVRLSRRRMPTLELIHEKFARTVRLTLFNMVRAPVEVTVDKPEVKSYGDFMKAFPERTNINLVNVRSLRGMACWCVDPSLIYVAIDNIFGGDGRLDPSNEVKEYTATELRIVRRIMDGILNEYEKAWRSVYQMKFEFVRSETSFAFAKITSHQEMVIHTRFNVDINGRSGDIDLCIPVWVLEPLKGLLYENTQVFSAEPDKNWVERLHNEIQSTNVQAVAVLARKEVLLGDILSLAVGEIIPIEISDPVTVYVDGLPVIRGKYGVRNGRYAVKVESIKHPVEYLKAPLEHGRLGPSVMREAERGELYEAGTNRAGQALEAALRDEEFGAGGPAAPKN
jgi:flagellar motor switch protein FliM